MDQSLKEIITQKKQKSPIDTQLFTWCNSLLKDLTETINANMSNDLKNEYGYDFIKMIKDIMILFAKSYLYKDNEKKQEYAESIYDKTIDLDMILSMMELYKNDDKTNKLGISKGKLLEIKKEIGKIESHFEKWRNSIYTKHSEENNINKKNALTDFYDGL